MVVQNTANNKMARGVFLLIVRNTANKKLLGSFQLVVENTANSKLRRGVIPLPYSTNWLLSELNFGIIVTDSQRGINIIIHQS